MRLLQLTIIFTILFSGHSDSLITPNTTPLLVAPAVAYHPRGYIPAVESQGPSRKQIIADLRLLRKSGFSSIVSYGSIGALGFIPEIARREGFDGSIIMGIWDINSNEERTNAIVQKVFVDGYCLGNEGLGVRYSPDELETKMVELRQLTGKPVTTSEPMGHYLKEPYGEWLLANSDWLFPNFFPVWNAKLNIDHSVKWVIAYHDYLTAVSDKPLIIKEVGLPTALSEGLSEEAQLLFFESMGSTEIPFFYFEAFDQPWKRDVLNQPEYEAHWGIYHEDGSPKEVIKWLAKKWVIKR